jgi:hypothetical protein
LIAAATACACSFIGVGIGDGIGDNGLPGEPVGDVLTELLALAGNFCGVL